MGLLEKQEGVAAVLAMTKDPKRGISVTIASPAGIADKIALTLKERGIAESGGGRATIAGAQKLKVKTLEELLNVVASIVEEL